jgi:hypothetical protein
MTVTTTTHTEPRGRAGPHGGEATPLRQAALTALAGAALAGAAACGPAAEPERGAHEAGETPEVVEPLRVPETPDRVIYNPPPSLERPAADTGAESRRP